MAIHLTDDGTLDTVLRCDRCGEEMRYSNDCGSLHDEEDAEDCYLSFVEWAIEDASADHVCPGDDVYSDVEHAEPSEPDEDDITTTDHETFYQNGRCVLACRHKGNPDGLADYWNYCADDRTRRFEQLGMFKDYRTALRAYMDRVQFWPNVWFISDHGNAHLIDLSEGKE